MWNIAKLKVLIYKWRRICNDRIRCWWCLCENLTYNSQLSRVLASKVFLHVWLRRDAKCCKNVGPDKMLPNILQNSGERKEFEQFLVKAQKETQSVLLPFSIGGDTLYQASESNQDVLQTPGTVKRLKSLWSRYKKGLHWQIVSKVMNEM